MAKSKLEQAARRLNTWCPKLSCVPANRCDVCIDLLGAFKMGGKSVLRAAERMSFKATMILPDPEDPKFIDEVTLEVVKLSDLRKWVEGDE